MVKLKKFDLEGKEAGHVNIDAKLAKAEANGQMVKDYIIALRANARQWSANTKGRSEVSHSTKKPHPQKGGGRSRQGSLAAPQYKGGGRVFGPKPKFDQHVRINKKERQAAIRFLIGEKIRDDKILIVDDLKMKEPKTKKIVDFLKAKEIKGRILFLGEGNFTEVETAGEKQRVSVSTVEHDNFIKSMRNLPKTEFALVSNISGYDVLVARHIIMTESAYNELAQWLC